MSRLHTEVHGQGWLLSVQRWRADAVPLLSSNLGAAPLSPVGLRTGIRRVAVRLAESDRFWIAVAAKRDLPVAGALVGGRVLEDTILASAADETVWHRFARIAGEAAEGIRREQVPMFQKPSAAGYSVAISVGQTDSLYLCIFDATDFDRSFGSYPSEPEPRVYGGWRLP